MHREQETKYEPEPDATAPDWLAVDDVREVREVPSVQLVAVYFDTIDLRLARAGGTLRRREGGPDAGWHVKVPAGRARTEIQRPLGRATTPTKAVRDLVAGWTRGAPLAPVAAITTARRTTLLLGEAGESLAEFADDRVTGTTPDGDSVEWREWELELIDGDADLLADADDLLTDAGVGPAATGTKLARVLGDVDDDEQHLRRPKAGKPAARVVHARLAELVGDLARRDVPARMGTDEGVHKLRVSCRRLRAVLAFARPVLDRDVTDPVRDELRWLAGVLGEARDATVVHERLRGLVEEEPRHLVHGPVLPRLRATYRGRGLADVRAALLSPRYFALRDRLDALVADPPWTELADAPASAVLPKMLRKELKRVRKRARAAAAEDDAPSALHEVRKATKRLRYSAEAVEPVAGKPAHKLASAAKHLTSHLGELQDTVVSRSELLGLARAAAAHGEPGFTYGRLYTREEQHAAALADGYDSGTAMRELRRRTDKAVKAVR